jgi:hypothetical protein
MDTQNKKQGPLTLPPQAKARMMELRAQRGTHVAMAYAHAVLNHLREQANVEYMRRHVGAPWQLALGDVAVKAPILAVTLWALWGVVAPPMFLAMASLGIIFVVLHAAGIFVDGGRY